MMLTEQDFDQLRHGFGLTEREVEILSRVALGHANRTIARDLFIAEKTVKAHLASVFLKMRVENRTQAAVAYLYAKHPQIAEGAS